MAVSEPRRGPGRPRDLAKRRAIIDAAFALFLADGPAAVPMEAVAARAGVSKMTLYSHFPDKDALFEAVVIATNEQMIAEMERVQAAGGGLAESLCALGEAFLTKMCRDEVVAADRWLVGYLSANQTLARRFYEAGPAGIVRAAAEVLTEAAARDEIAIEDPAEAADDLMSLWLGDLFRRLSFGLGPAPTPEEITRRVRRKTETFLRSCRR